ncbi:MAG TPA: hypothetical protein VM661_07295 [Candidatus Sulfotelmatobacter sp.]|jgi:hypothetical protein|nr:hypothetical protein [Candidatus Sulfotelmatobacter sp.]
MEKTQYSLILGDTKMPIDIHHLGVEDGDHEAGTKRDNFRFTFVWRMLKFQAAYHEQGGAEMDLSAEIGPFPFSAESPQARVDLKAIIAAANSQLGPVFQERQGRIVLIRRLPVILPVTAVGLITAVTGFLLKIAPYLDCIATVMATPLEVAKGAPRLRPNYRRRPAVKGNRQP